jgi:hypothetical protein
MQKPPTLKLEIPNLELPKEKLRAYDIEGHIYPSVTSILSYVFGLPSEMGNWISKHSALRALRELRARTKAGEKPTQELLVKIAQTERHRLLKEAQLKGTTVHTWIEEFFNGKAPKDIPTEYAGYWKAFEKFYSFYPVEPLSQEEVVFSHPYKFAGRMDFYGTWMRGGELRRVLIDFKTSNFLQSQYGLQLAAYKQCLEETERPVDDCFILKLQSHGRYEFVPFTERFDDFLLARKLFSWKVKMETPEFELAFTPQEAIEVLSKEIKTPG